MRVMARRIDDDEVAACLQAGQLALPAGALLGFGDIQITRQAGTQDHLVGNGQVHIALAGPAGAVFQMAGEGGLTQIEIDGRHHLAHAHQRDGEVNGDGGFARPALLIAHHDHMRLAHAGARRLGRDSLGHAQAGR